MRKRKLFALIMVLVFITSTFTGLSVLADDNTEKTKIADLTVNYKDAPIGVEQSEAVVFGWRMESNVIGQAQTAYQITVSDAEDTVWDTSILESGKSVGIIYAGDALKAETKYTVNLTVIDTFGQRHQESSTFETGTDWKTGDAEWITMPDFKGEMSSLAFRTEKALTGSNVKSARLYMTSLGVHDAYINGEKVLLNGKNVVTAPGAVEAELGTTYQTYDVTSYIADSTITLGALVGNGYYGSAKGGYRDNYAIGATNLRELCILAKLVINYADGSTQVIETVPGDWKVSGTTPVVANDLVKGEVYDAAIATQMSGWNKDGYDVSEWETAVGGLTYSGVLRASDDSLIYDYETMKFVDAYVYDPGDIVSVDGKNFGQISGETHYSDGSPITLAAGKVLVLDFGQNSTSMPEITVSGAAGTTLNIQPGEVVSDGKGSGNQGPGGGLSLTEDDLSGDAPMWWTPVMGSLAESLGISTEWPPEASMVPAISEALANFAPAAPGGGTTISVDTYSFPTEFAGSYASQNADGEVFKGVVQGKWVYQLAGSESSSPETYRAQFHYGGHRFLQLTADTDIVIHDVKNIAVSSVGEDVIEFESSNEIIDRFVENVKWSQASNYISVPTDCPTREYRGWTGDANVFAETALYTVESSALFKHYNWLMQDYYMNSPDTEQGAGKYGNHHPTENSMDGNANGNGWSDVGITFPWQYYQQTGDLSMLEYSWEAVSSFVDKITREGELFKGDPLADALTFGYSDIGLSDHNNKDTAPTKTFMAAIYAYYDTTLAAKIAEALGETEAAEKYNIWAQNGRKFMIDRYLDTEGNVLCATRDMASEGDSMYTRVDNPQTALSWMLLLDLYDTDAQRQTMAENLSASVINKGNTVSENRGEYTLSVGFLGANVLMPAMGKAGLTDAAYGLMTSSNPYGLSYALTEPPTPATTTWEVWALWEKDGGYKSGESQNHYSYGAPAQWLYQYVLGIQRDELNPGFKHIILQPQTEARLTYVDGRHKSFYGNIVSGWKAENGDMQAYSFTLPANTTATLYLPVARTFTDGLSEGTNLVEGITYLGREVHNGLDCAKFSVLSGGYELDLSSGVIQAKLAMDYIVIAS